MTIPRLHRFAIIVLLSAVVLFFSYLTRPDQPGLFWTRLNQISIGVEQRILIWDWKDTEEEILCRGYQHNNGDRHIPHVVHYVILGIGGRLAEISYATFLAIKATLLRLRPDAVKIHTYSHGFNRTNPWWKVLEGHVDLVEHDQDSLEIHGIPLNSLLVQHQSDMVRLVVLYHEGGIYLDTDVFPLKQFTDLLYNERGAVLGHEGGNRYGLCNAVILARPRSEFLRLWIESYATFNDHLWNYHSVRMPKLLQVQHPHLVCPLSPTVFFWPTWAGVHGRYMTELIDPRQVDELQHNMSRYHGAMYENQLAIHKSPDLRSADTLIENTRFNILMRDLVNAEIL